MQCGHAFGPIGLRFFTATDRLRDDRPIIPIGMTDSRINALSSDDTTCWNSDRHPSSGMRARGRKQDTKDNRVKRIDP